MSRTRIGAIGCGYWGPNLIRNFIEIPNTRVLGVADLDGGRLAHVRERYPQIGTLTNDYRDLFGLGLDAVVVSTPPETHYDIVRDCLEHGLHVLVEKPLVTRSAEARELIAVAERNERILMVGHTFLYNPAVHALRDLVVHGELGDVLYIDAVRAGLGLFHPRLNVIWDLAPHDISIASFLLGAAPVAVAARGAACLNETVEDVAYLTLTFPGNVLYHVRLSWLDPSKTRRTTVIGSQKMAVYDDVEPLEKLRIYDKRVDSIRRTDTFGEFQFAYHYGNVVIPHIRFEEPLRLECLHFADCVARGARPRTDASNGLVVVETIEAAQRSLANGGASVPVGTAAAPAVENVTPDRGPSPARNEVVNVG
ncbi:Gfo/Idh/MocA family protein [Egicoccus sp. AB-alg2]|uniref:Gfo/Idh/MocA family protein n=1 Tax=Egicoccus sp. AB-alg2 TaxID=3242693 RepID=UPI00359D2C64